MKQFLLKKQSFSIQYDDDNTTQEAIQLDKEANNQLVNNYNKTAQNYQEEISLNTNNCNNQNYKTVSF